MIVELTVNGEPVTARVTNPGSLLDLLRDELGLPGSKNACEQGECGSCSVILDGELVCSCLVMAADTAGSSVTTVEGVSPDDGLHPVQEAMHRAGAVQCGFCTPGIVVAAVDLFARNPQPSSDRDQRGSGREHLPVHRIRRHHPRPRERGDGAASDHRDGAAGPGPGGGVGESPLRPDGVPKLRGEFDYAQDLRAEGMLWAATVRSPHARARIVSIDLAPALAIGGVHACLTSDDVPGRATFGLEHPDQPVLAGDEVRFWGEPVAVVAAEDAGHRQEGGGCDRGSLRSSSTL